MARSMLIGEIIQANVTDETSNKTHVEWKIRNYSCIEPPFNIELPFNPHFKSPPFPFANTSWYIYLYLNRCISISLKNEADIDFEVNFSFGIRKPDGDIDIRILPTSLTTETDDYELTNTYFIEKLGYLEDDALTITCDLECIPQRREARHLNKDNMNIAGLEILSRNFKDYLAKKEDCDAVLIVQGKEFKAHRNILTARSSVFAAMFRHDTAERKTGQVNIADCNSNYFQEFLEYLYSGRLEAISSENAFPLYEAANKYNIQDLKELCIDYLMKNLTVQNVCKIFTFAEEHDETELLESARTYFKKHFEEISNTPEWDNLLKDDLPLVTKLLKK